MDEQNKSMKERWDPPTNRGERGYATDPGFSSGAEYAGRPDVGTTSGDAGDEASAQRTTEIRQEIDEARANMGETIDAIQERLRPGNVAARAAESVRDATVGRVKEFAGNLTGRSDSPNRDRDDDWRYRSSGWDGTSDGLVDRIRNNPIAAAMAAGSIAWLVFGGRRVKGYQYSRIDRERGLYGSTRDGQAFVREARLDLDDSQSSYGFDRSERGVGSELSQNASQMSERARETAADAAQRVKYAASDAGRRTRNFASASPLATGAIAAAVGLAVGLAIPETERENEVLGEARDSMIDRGRDAVRTAAERVQSAAGEVQRVAGDALKGIAPAGSNEGGSSQGGKTTAQNAGSQSTDSASGADRQPQTAASGLGESGTEQPVPGAQAGSGGTGGTPTSKTVRPRR